MPFAQTITVVNRSGKVVKTSKHLVNVFKDAKSAYQERKAEIKAVRKSNVDEPKKRRALRRLEADENDWDRDSRASSRRSSIHSDSTDGRRPVSADRRSPDRLHSKTTEISTTTRSESAGRQLVRRRTDGQLGGERHMRPESHRSASLDDIDMSLAYGELPPPLPLRPRGELDELRNKVSRLQSLLDEAKCVQYSAFAMIESLQKNPDQLAAVALTLAEISNIASKMAPAALTGMKGVFPAVFALLASPEFMIAAGVGVGVTIIALGGYKIIKRIKKKKESDKVAIEDAPVDEADDELQEIRSDLSRIEVWRRGIAEAQADSVATSVDGEFITPVASRQLIEQGRLRESDLKSMKGSKTKKHEEKEKRSKEAHKKRRDSGGEDEGSVFEKGKAFIRDPNGLRSLFKKDARRTDASLA
ncbi:hypothetical protein ANO11243_078240 [Dothideomycetidae sp. 11243]|nr:hypothetical protein ANO11243_078240 [fungal sp. No.11243]